MFLIFLINLLCVHGPQRCELVVDRIDNNVAFGLLFDDEEMNRIIHGVPLHLDVHVSRWMAQFKEMP